MTGKEDSFKIGPVFKATRTFYRLSQKEFATILGVTQGSISKIESHELTTELSLWFRFLKRFKIVDPYCFTSGYVEFKESVFEILKTQGSFLAPNFDFKGGHYVCTMMSLRPIYLYLVEHKNAEFTKYLTKNLIAKEIFHINNHPLPKDFIDSFFKFLKKNNINDETLSFLVPGFDRSSIYNNEALKKSS